MSHGERTRVENVGWVYMYSVSETCVCVNQGDIKFERDRGAPIRLSGVRQIAERGKEIFHPLDNAVHVIFLEVKLWKL